MTNTKLHTVVLIPGDGIGPEVTSAVRQVLQAADAPIKWEEHHAGITALAHGHDVLPQETLDAIIHHKVALKGPCTTPVGKGFSSINVLLRKKLNLYAAVRPVRSLPGYPTRFEDVDLVIIRENTEGLYSGVENEVTPGVVMSMKVASDAACTRIARWAFRYATHRKRKKITVFHKANIMKMTDGLFMRCAQQIQENEYPNIELQSLIIDAGCMKLVQDPTQFDILLMENLYGDVVSDLCAGLVGGLGVVPGANIGDEQAVFEAVHGSAPDIAGRGIANPVAQILAGAMMLDQLGEAEAARSVETAVEQVLAEGRVATPDLGGKATTEQLGSAIAAAV